jgi:hypothetical protein
VGNHVDCSASLTNLTALQEPITISPVCVYTRPGLYWWQQRYRRRHRHRFCRCVYARPNTATVSTHRPRSHPICRQFRQSTVFTQLSPNISLNLPFRRPSRRFRTPPLHNLCALLVFLVLATCAVRHGTRWTLYNRHPPPPCYLTVYSDRATSPSSSPTVFLSNLFSAPRKVYDSRESHWPWQLYRQEQSDR